ncbi:MAG: T9SS type A sorting domain-containing protein [Legionella sp.]|uniref:LamG-like jellyroll fold domain-containing protein n=1 Tax=Legionella sp. TaxID=459 RepID=UPI002840FDB7|nr:T9SS type A sorting domain-containing protein [Legionella sp.]
MKTILLAIIYLTILNSVVFGQIAKSPYPIIFVHGLNDGDGTWDTTISFLGGPQKIFDVCLNHDGDSSNATLAKDVDPIGWRDNISNTPSPTGLYAINFDNTRFSQAGHSYHTLSNQAAIFKQGQALQMMIREVLRLEGVDKVILVGHSMGGLAIREYLQRVDDKGNHIWWMDPSDLKYGHHVAKVVTIGTPHGGSDAPAILGSIKGVNQYSEAVRDLRYSLNLDLPGVYLFGGNENTILDNYYNYDINCNGNLGDPIIGISEIYNDLTGIYYLITSPTQPLPQNIQYTWIVSKYTLSPTGDYVVSADRQWLYDLNKNVFPLGISDTLMTNRFHTDEPSDYSSIVRGLDEPDNINFAYAIGKNSKTRGFITYQTDFNPIDHDMFKVLITNNGFLSFKIDGFPDFGVERIELQDSNGTVIAYKSGSSLFDTLTYQTFPGTYYINLRGVATAATIMSPYTLTTSYAELQIQSPNGGESYLSGSTVNIQWTSNNIDNVKVEYTIDGGSNWNTIIASTPASSYSYSWTVPNTLSTNCKVRISDVANLAISDTSNNTFTISGTTTIDTTGLVAYYPFSGNANDMSGNGNNGIVYNATLTADRFGNLNQAYSFNGSSYINIPELFPDTVNGFTYSLWIILNNLPSYQAYIINKGTLMGEVAILVNSSGQVKLEVKQTDLMWHTIASHSIDTNVVYHIVGRYIKGSNFDLWVNGVKATSKSNLNLNLYTSNETVSSIGAYNYMGTYSQYWDGIIDDIRVYKRALSDAEIQVLYKEAGWLPVELTSFTANISDGIVTLNWKTATEVNNIGFNVERSGNKSDWTNIAFVQGHQTSTLTIAYSYIDKSISQAGKYYYRLKQIDNAGSYKYSSIAETDLNPPSVFTLSQNFPNPFNPSARINYSIPHDSRVTLEVYNITGERISELINEEQSAGYYSVDFNSSSIKKSISSGVYFYRIIAIDKVTGNNFLAIKKMILLK